MKKAQEQVNRIDILGTEYSILKQTPDENPKLKDADGLCEAYAKKILLDVSPETDPDTVENFDAYCHRVLRHEAFHAIFHETGLSKYYNDEDLVEMLAILYPRIRKIMDTMDALDIDKI